MFLLRKKYQEWRRRFAAERRGAAEPSAEPPVARTDRRPSPDGDYGAETGSAGKEVDGEVEAAVNCQQQMGDFDEIRNFLENKHKSFQTF